jgi:methylmalonyl-CoA/ethylmalonyl-CoA epimerase
MMTNSMTVGVTGIGQIFITAYDLKRAIAFYRDTLGLPFLFQAPPDMAFFQCGNVRLMLGKPEKPELEHPASIIYYRVDDIQRAHRALTDRGVLFMGEPTAVHKTEQIELWLAFFHDSEQNILALMSEVPRAGKLPPEPTGSPGR